jgi:hypothetical protein
MTQKKPATLKSYGRAFQTISMSASADARIRQALDTETPRARRWFPVAWALPIVAACSFLLFWFVQSVAPTERACDVTRESADTRYAGRCDVELNAMTVHLEADATFVQQEGSVLLSAGTAHFSVRKVQPGEPAVEIRVPEASIVVLGTEFSVTVSDHASRVHLRSGRVRFVHQGHGAVEMWPGQQLTFETKTGKTEVVTVSATSAGNREPEAAPMATPPQSSTPANSEPELAPPSNVDAQLRSRSSHSEAASAREVSARAATTTGATTTSASTTAPPSDLQAALELRAQGRYDEALARLDHVNPESAHAREVVDFEQATLTELQSPERACARYRQHLERFPKSRYRTAVLQKLGRCASTTGTSAAESGATSP